MGHNEEEKVLRNAPYKLVDHQWIESGDTKMLVKTTYTARDSGTGELYILSTDSIIGRARLLGKTEVSLRL